MGAATSSGGEALNDMLEFFERVLPAFCGVGCYGFVQRKIRELVRGQDLELCFACVVALGKA